MKPELTPELKERFFALYWGQEVFCWPGVFDQKISGSTFAGGIDIEDFLFLRPISSITDEEAIEVAKIGHLGSSYTEESTIYHGKVLLNDYINSSRCNLRGYDWMNIQDYLRSIAIALPFMGHSVESLVEAGWIKLVEQ